MPELELVHDEALGFEFMQQAGRQVQIEINALRERVEHMANEHTARVHAYYKALGDRRGVTIDVGSVKAMRKPDSVTIAWTEQEKAKPKGKAKKA